MSDNKEVEDMEKFMNVLMEVKVSLAEQSGKLDNLLDMKEKINETYDIAKGARNKNKELEKDIQELKESIEKKADVEDVKKEVKRREDLLTNVPAWGAVLISLAGFLINYLIN